ncbi:MAG: hypothetical protein WBL20_00970 [Sphingobium sp.]
MRLTDCTKNPDIAMLLTAVVMPGTNGRQLVDAVIALRPDLHVIYMTGYTRNAIIHNGTAMIVTRFAPPLGS